MFVIKRIDSMAVKPIKTFKIHDPMSKYSIFLTLQLNKTIPPVKVVGNGFQYFSAPLV